MADQSKYREIDFLGGRILEARELMTLQSILRGVDPSGNAVTYDLDQIYREGATMNIHVAVSGLVVTCSPVDNSFPMVVFVRGRWEVVSSDDLGPLTLSSSQTHIYLNYAVRIVTSVEDTSLVDSTTSQATANMGELDLDISVSDTSGVSLDPTTQMDKNTVPIVLFLFTNSGTVLTYVPQDNVLAPALAGIATAGLVKTTTANPIVVSTDDSRMTNGRSPSSGTVVDASVRSPVVQSGVNADGSSRYDLVADPGGISADKIIWQSATERLTDFLSWIKAQFISLLSTVNSHIGQPLGSGSTHPMPNASQVGAAPASHVGQQLGLPGSHPPFVTTDTAGFGVFDSGAAGSSGAAYGLYKASALVAGIMHNGDFGSTLLNSVVVVPGGVGITFAGALTSLANVAVVLRDHVNQNSHGNPHGLTLADLGGLSPAGYSALMGSPGGIHFPASMAGFTVLWGTASLPDDTWASIAFPTIGGITGFSHACFGVVANQSNDIGSNNRTISTRNQSATGFQVLANGSGASIFWIALGW